MKFNRDKFFTGVRSFLKSNGQTLTQKRVDALEFLITQFEDRPWSIQKIAYAFATVYHETAHTFQPIYEMGQKSYFNKYEPGTRIGRNLGNTEKGDGYKYRGAGFVQITGRANFRKFGLEANPEIAIHPQVAFKILSRGMTEGLFTGKRLADFINEHGTDYVNARKIINGTDKAKLIAGYAQAFEQILKDSAASPSKPATNQLASKDAVPPTEAPPIIDPPNTITDEPTPPTEVKTTEVTETTKTEVTTKTGNPPTDAPTKVTKNGPLAKWLFTGGGLTTFGTAIWGFITGHLDAVAIGIVCLTVLIFALIFRGAITDAIRMQTAADPEKYNVE